MSFNPDIGAVYLGDGRTRFRVWAPFRQKVQVLLLSPVERIADMERDQRGYWSAEVEGVEIGARYFIRLDGSLDRPDPASFDQPDGVHGPSRVLDPSIGKSTLKWPGIPLRDYIFYELHVGTFTPEGTFDAVISRLDSLKDLGITSIEIMPVAQFPGSRNWGYDGACPFAVQNSYGGPEGLKRLVEACHEKGLCVTLDVVYNHFGPEGNYLRDFGPYFTGKYKTPWGDALNFDNGYSDEVRHYFIQNALFWFGLYNVDALRLDAVHAIYDFSAIPFLRRLAEKVGEYGRSTGRQLYLIAESDLNDSRLIRSRGEWGYGLDSQWSDDLHHSLHVLLTGEKKGYYSDFGSTADLAKAMKDGYVYSGQYSEYRKRSHGNRSADLPSEKFVVAAQNHDQVGNRMLGERLSSLVSFEALKLSAAAVLLSPFIPLLFMGEEYGEEAPFLYFVSHTNPELMEAVRLGRKEEFREFLWHEEPPDPGVEETFIKTKISWEKKDQGRHATLLRFYKELISMRRSNPALLDRDRKNMDAEVFENRKVMVMKRGEGCKGEKSGNCLIAIFNFDSGNQWIGFNESGLEYGYRKILDSAEDGWDGPGSTLPAKIVDGGPLELMGSSVAVFEKD